MRLLTVFMLLLATTVLGRDRPNVIIIYGDDVGQGDVGAYGSKMIPTPNIDRLAEEGLRFTDGHCSASTCTPSRYGMLTGVHGFRNGVRVLPPNAPLTISTHAFTLPKLFKQAGYHTAIIGKWHLGLGQKGTPVDWNADVKPGPLEIGFDYSFLLPSTNDRVPCVYLKDHRVLNLSDDDPLYIKKAHPGSTTYPDGKKDIEAMTYKSTHGHNQSVINGIGRIGYMSGGQSALWNDETMADVFVEEMREYITARKDQPFFLFFSSQDIHVPRVPHPRFHGKSELGLRGDAMVQLDWTTGQIMETLEKCNLSENTLVIFSSDNGPVYDDGYDDGTTVKTSRGESDRGHDGSGIYRGGKYQVYEGGTRVPFIVRWPKQIAPGTSDALVTQIDFIASFAAHFDIEIPKGEARDSQNTWLALMGKETIGRTVMVEQSQRRLGMRRGLWKYVGPQKPWPNQKDQRLGPPELYHLKDDLSERNNVIAEHPELAKSLKEEFDKIVADPKNK